jgi:SAM-dependent methyltransferase
MTSDYYDELAPFYKLMYVDWEKSVQRQAVMLDGILKDHAGTKVTTVLDVSCGIGTQSIGLAQLGYQVCASALSPAEVEMARQEAMNHGVDIEFRVGDMRDAWGIYEQQFDCVISCDNSIPHLLNNADILRALRQFHQCVKSGGCCLISVRDYAKLGPPQAQISFNPRLVHDVGGERVVLFDLWKNEGDLYEMSTYIVQDRGEGDIQTRVVHGGKYYRVSIDTLCELFTRAGFSNVAVLHDRFFQPVIFAYKS